MQVSRANPFISAAFVALLAIGMVDGALAQSKEEARASVRKASSQTLAALYKLAPAARRHVEGAAGYATFSNFGMKLFFAGGGTGAGLAVNNKTRKEVFMKMVEVQAGLGFGIKTFRLVWVFDTQKAFDNFVNSGWEFGAQANASAKVGQTGAAATGALAVSPGVWLYQFTDDGLALELTAKGTKYYRNDELN
jgi:lipid-binding SYLF domain-containing protein